MKHLIKILSVVLLLVLLTSAVVSCKSEEKVLIVKENETNFLEYSSLTITDLKVEAYDVNGKKIPDKDTSSPDKDLDDVFIEYEGNIYLLYQGYVVTGYGVSYKSRGIYYFDETTGAYQDRVVDKVFVDFDNEVFYAVGNKVVTGNKLIGEYIYNFDSKGIMSRGYKDGLLYDQDGRLQANNYFVTDADGATYYLVNNRIVYGQMVIGNAIYDFGKDGKMVVSATTADGYTYDKDGKMVLANSGLVMINNNKYTVYYLEKNVVKEGEYTVLSELIYCDDNGVLFIGKKDGAEYLKQNSTVLLADNSLWIVINNTLYKESEDFDGDGVVNIYEIEMGTDLTNKDTDGDGRTDNIDNKPTDPKYY